MYGDFVKNISEKINKFFSEIKATYGFELGDEFEIALCKLLREILPTKYGICRGYVVASNGNQAGDDIIVYEQLRYPTIRSLKKEEYAIKEYVPFDAVYCYIEAKHTLVMHSRDKNFDKALQQTATLKNYNENQDYTHN